MFELTNDALRFNIARMGGSLTDASLDATLWTQVVGEVTLAMDCVGAGLIPQRRSLRAKKIVASSSMLPVLAAYLKEGWHLHDLRDRAWEVLRNKDYCIDDDFASAQEQANLPYYKFLQRHDVQYFLALRLETPTGLWALILYLKKPFNPESPVLEEALGMRNAIQAMVHRATRRVNEALDQLIRAAVLTGRHCAILEVGRGVTAASEEFASLAPDLILADRQLSARDERLSLFLDEFAAGKDIPSDDLGHVFLVEGTRDRIIADLAPLPPGLRHHFVPDRLWITFRRVPVSTTGPEAQLTIRHGLSAGELRLATAIADGTSLKQAAAEFGLSEGTVRQQAKAIFRKTGLSSQTQLAALVWRLRRDHLLG